MHLQQSNIQLSYDSFLTVAWKSIPRKLRARLREQTQQALVAALGVFGRKWLRSFTTLCREDVEAQA